MHFSCSSFLSPKGAKTPPPQNEAVRDSLPVVSGTGCCAEGNVWHMAGEDVEIPKSELQGVGAHR